MHAKIAALTATSTILLLGFLWGFSEALWFFVIPDVLLTLVALFSLRRALMAMGWTIF